MQQHLTCNIESRSIISSRSPLKYKPSAFGKISLIKLFTKLNESNFVSYLIILSLNRCETRAGAFQVFVYPRFAPFLLSNFSPQK